MSSDTKGQVIQCKAAVAYGPKKDLKIETINVAAPLPGEVRIKIVAASLCHTDAFCLEGGDPEQPFPIVLGHEGAGIVESVGTDVKSVSVGDHVIAGFVPQCNECEHCKHPSGTNLCKKLPLTKTGLCVDHHSSFYKDNTMINRYMGVGAFSQYIVQPEYAVAKIDKSAPLDKICLLGCGISTGYGASVNTAKITKGSSVAVWGLGTVGLACVMGAKNAGAKTIVGFDTNEHKFELAKKFGVTECLNPDNYKDEDAFQKLLDEKYNSGFDFTLEASGDEKAMEMALRGAHIGWGTCVMVGVVSSRAEMKVRPGDVLVGRKWTGTAFGDYKCRDDLPKLVQQYMKGEIMVDEFITHHFKIDDINKALKLLNDGKALRSVLTFE